MYISRSFGHKISGVYSITNLTNGKTYVGSSRDIYHRLKRHQSELRRGIHFNKHLQNNYNKYGPSSFKVAIVEKVAHELLLETEQKYVNTLKPAYNITTDVIHNTPSAASRLKISNTLKEIKRLGLLKFPLHEDTMIPVTIYDLKCN
jgi:group I intron endonuclease